MLSVWKATSRVPLDGNWSAVFLLCRPFLVSLGGYQRPRLTAWSLRCWRLYSRLFPSWDPGGHHFDSEKCWVFFPGFRRIIFIEMFMSPGKIKRNQSKILENILRVTHKFHRKRKKNLCLKWKFVSPPNEKNEKKTFGVRLCWDCYHSRHSKDEVISPGQRQKNTTETWTCEERGPRGEGRPEK